LELHVRLSCVVVIMGGHILRRARDHIRLSLIWIECNAPKDLNSPSSQQYKDT